MSEYRVLFVDDDSHILMGIKRLLYSMRSVFYLKFAESGKQALEIMGHEDFDVVVSDMRMPGLDGSELLTRIKDMYPTTIRIMLTGQADEEAILRTVGVVHQFLAKPCAPAELKAVLLRAGTLHALLADPELKKIVSQLGTLPSIPEVYDKLRRAMIVPDVSIAEVAQIIEQDMAMSAKVLQLVNSAFFGLFQKVENPKRAVSLLGIETVKGLVLGVGAFSSIKTSSKVFSINKLWAHSVTVADLAKNIASSVSDDTELINNSFLAGMLHDIGKLVFLAKMTKQYEQSVLQAQESNMPLRESEKRVFYTGHDDIGAYLMGIWGLPVQVVEAIGFHHRLNEHPVQEFNPAVAVHIADALYFENCPDESVGKPDVIDTDYIKFLGLSEKIESWRQICSESIEQRSS